MENEGKVEMTVGEILNRVPQDLALVVLLKEKDGTRCLPVLTGPLEAQAIAISLYGHKMPRPGIYDLYIKTLKSFDGYLAGVEIYRIRGGIFYSHLFIEKDGNMSYIDCRTSDAVALAVRSGVPITIDSALLDANCVRLEGNGAYSMPITTASTQVLKDAMKQAVASENYEFAARLRDEINSRNESDDESLID